VRMQLAAEVNGDDGEEKRYMPHYTLFKHESRTTNLRVVFDASAKGTNWELLTYTFLIVLLFSKICPQ